MPRRYNLERHTVIVDHGRTAVPPGHPHEFTEEQVRDGIGGTWSEEDPRRPVVVRSKSDKPAEPESAPEGEKE